MSNDPIAHFEREVERHRRGLADEGRRLGERLIRLADSLDAGRGVVNSLGEIQADGAQINARCGAYSQAREALDAARAYLS